jgi:hypothetical protein
MPDKLKIKFENPMVGEVFLKYPPAIRERLLFLRELVLDLAKKTRGVGALEETLKWGEPSYLTSESGSGSTIRMHTVRGEPNKYALYFNCKTTLVGNFREKFPTKLRVSGNRAVVFDLDEKFPLAEVKICLISALTYNLTKLKK